MLICMILFISLIVHYAVLLGGLIILQQVADEKVVIKGKWSHRMLVMCFGDKQLAELLLVMLWFCW